MAVRFELDPRFEENFLRDVELRSLIDDLTGKVAGRSRQLVAGSSHRIAENIETDTTLGPGGWVGRVIADIFWGGFVEFGTSQHPARPYLRPALESEVGPLRDGTDA